MSNVFINTDLGKVKKTKIAMLVSLVLLNILATIALFFMMTNSTILTTGSSMNEAIVTLYGFSLNVSLVFAVIIAILWLIAFVLFYEMKTDDELEERVEVFKAIVDSKMAELDLAVIEHKDYIETQKAINPKYAVDPDLIK